MQGLWETLYNPNFNPLEFEGVRNQAGLVFNGMFISDPYPADDWAGSTKRRMYVDMICTSHAEPGAKPHYSLEKLQQAIPEFDWAQGHSGELLPEEIASKLGDLLEEE